MVHPGRQLQWLTYSGGERPERPAGPALHLRAVLLEAQGRGEVAPARRGDLVQPVGEDQFAGYGKSLLPSPLQGPHDAVVFGERVGHTDGEDTVPPSVRERPLRDALEEVGLETVVLAGLDEVVGAQGDGHILLPVGGVVPEAEGVSSVRIGIPTVEDRHDRGTGGHEDRAAPGTLQIGDFLSRQGGRAEDVGQDEQDCRPDGPSNHRLESPLPLFRVSIC